MKKLFVAIVLLVVNISFGQNSTIGQMVDSLQYMKTDTLDCSADLYWRIVAKRREALPFLFEKLDDTTQTNINFLCKRTKLNVG